MARPLRIEFDGALYHVTSRGNDRKAIFNATGVRVTKLPLSPENVLRALKEGGKA